MKKRIIIVSLVVLGILLLLYGTYQWMNARTFQLFGGLTSQVETDRKVVALTFDDGPTVHVEEILPLLKQYNAKATFFLIGSELKENVRAGKQIAEAGHQIGNHSYSHERMVFKPLSFMESEVQQTSKLIRQTGYEGEIDFRPPNGKKLVLLPYYLNKINMDTIMWNLEPDTFYKSAKGQVDYVSEHVKPGSILLLHPMYGDLEEKLLVIEGILKSLSEKGYEFVTVNELQAMGGK